MVRKRWDRKLADVSAGVLNGVPAPYVYDPNKAGTSQALEIYSYGDDVYVLTSEYDKETDALMTYLWLNGKPIMSYPDIEAAGFTVF